MPSPRRRPTRQSGATGWSAPPAAPKDSDHAVVRGVHHAPGPHPPRPWLTSACQASPAAAGLSASLMSMRRAAAAAQAARRDSLPPLCAAVAPTCPEVWPGLALAKAFGPFGAEPVPPGFPGPAAPAAIGCPPAGRPAATAAVVPPAAQTGPPSLQAMRHPQPRRQPGWGRWRAGLRRPPSIRLQASWRQALSPSALLGSSFLHRSPAVTPPGLEAASSPWRAAFVGETRPRGLRQRPRKHRPFEPPRAAPAVAKTP